MKEKRFTATSADLQLRCDRSEVDMRWHGVEQRRDALSHNAESRKELQG